MPNETADTADGAPQTEDKAAKVQTFVPPSPVAPPVKATKSCGNCRFYRPILTQGHGIRAECRRESPKVFMVMMAGQRAPGWAGAFPPTSSELWCGEWAPKS